MNKKNLVVGVLLVFASICAVGVGLEVSRRSVELQKAAQRQQDLAEGRIRYDELERRSIPVLQRYYVAEGAERFTVIKEVIRMDEAADPKIWRFADWNAFISIDYARTALAAEAIGLTEEAAEFRKRAVTSWINRREWNASSKQMLPVTPVPEWSAAEMELFTMVRKMDQIFAATINHPQPTADAGTADNSVSRSVSDEVRERRAARQKAMTP